MARGGKLFCRGCISAGGLCEEPRKNPHLWKRWKRSRCRAYCGRTDEILLLPRSLPESFCSRAKKLYPQHADALTRLQGGIAAIPLVSGVALPTAFANDVDGQLCFAQQVYALARPGDVVWGISTSGNSANVNQALRVARLLSCRTLGLTGKDGGEMASLLDVELRAPASSTPQVQELHLPLYHALCACIEVSIFGE